MYLTERSHGYRSDHETNLDKHLYLGKLSITHHRSHPPTISMHIIIMANTEAILITICGHQPSLTPMPGPRRLGDREHYKLLRNMQFVHIDDVAAAHIFLFECPEARGRYLCSAVDTTICSLAGLLRARFPEFHIPDELLCGRVKGEGEEKPTIRLSSKKLQSLGFEFRYGLEEMFEGAIQCCKEKGFL